MREEHAMCRQQTEFLQCFDGANTATALCFLDVKSAFVAMGMQADAVLMCQLFQMNGASVA